MDIEIRAFFALLVDSFDGGDESTIVNGLSSVSPSLSSLIGTSFDDDDDDDEDDDDDDDELELDASVSLLLAFLFGAIFYKRKEEEVIWNGRLIDDI